MSRHSSWVKFRDSQSEAIAATGLPASIFRTDVRLINWLSDGTVKDETVDLREISDEQFMKLRLIIDGYFKDGWEQSSWNEFHKRGCRGPNVKPATESNSKSLAPDARHRKPTTKP